MAELGDLSLWVALPLLGAASVALTAGAWRDRGGGDLAMMGGRLVDGAMVMLLLALGGLGYALVSVQLGYSYVAANSGFQMAPGWRLAALWTEPRGAALTQLFLVTLCATLSRRLDHTRQASARTGSLALLAFVGLAIVLFRGRPFYQPEVPATVGSGLEESLQNVTYQVELWASFLASTFAALTFAGVVGEQMVETPPRAPQRRGRWPAFLAGAFLTVALVAAAWRAYSDTAQLLDPSGVARTATHAASWLIAIAYVHAPGGLSVPGWAIRWRRVLGVALFPTCLGATGALVGARGGIPPATLWSAGLAVGVLSGAMAGLARGDRGLPQVQKVPGFGLYALLGGLLALGFAGLVAITSLLAGPPRGWVVWVAVMFGLAAIVVWLILRPLNNRTVGWPLLVGLGAPGALIGAIVYFALGTSSIVFALISGIVAVLLAGLLLEALRLRAVRASVRRATPADPPVVVAVWRARGGRRMASIFGHLGVALLVLALAAGAATRSDTRLLRPGDRLDLASPPFAGGSVQITYLGLSRFQTGSLDKTAASFMLSRGGRTPKVVSAQSIYDFVSRRQTRKPALERGVLTDISVSIVSRGEGEDVFIRLAGRPLANLAWLGGGLLLFSMLIGGISDLPGREYPVQEGRGA